MLSDPKRLRTARGYGYLVSWKHRLHTRTEPAAAAIVERLLDDPTNVEALRNAIGNPGATLDELAEWLVTGLASGAFGLLKTRVKPPVFDAAPETNLVDLLPPEEPKQKLETLTFELRDHEGEGAAAHYQVYAPSGDLAGALPAGERQLVRDLEAQANVEVELTAIELPLRAKAEVPAPLGPGGEAPELPEPAPLGPGGEQPEPFQPPPRPRGNIAWFEARIVDELGESVQGVPLTFFIDGTSYSATTDATGNARIEAAAGRGTVSFDDVAGLVETLRPRWEEVREGQWIKDVEHHTLLSTTAPLPVVQLHSGHAHTLVFQPKVRLARIRGMLFDTNRAFLLPSALEHLPRLTALYADQPESTLLLVGHTDTTGEPEYNDMLSRERAISVAAFLRDDVEPWLAWFEDTVPVEKRWGGYEDTTMLAAVYLRTGEEVEGSPLRHFQITRGLEVDGLSGPNTRRVLISEYMREDGTTLPSGVDTQPLGCGERFPLDGEGEDIAPDAPNGSDVPLNRRVELFFFDKSLGVLPAAQAEIYPADDLSYVEWRRRAVETYDLDAGRHVYAIVLDDPIWGVAASVSVEAMYQTGKQLTLLADGNGRLRLEPGGGAYVDLSYTWHGQDVERRVFTAIDDVATPSGAWQRLVHLGHARADAPGPQPPDEAALEDALLSLQLDYGIEPTAELDDETVAVLLRVHDQDLRPWRDREWELPAEPHPDTARPKEEVS